MYLMRRGEEASRNPGGADGEIGSCRKTSSKAANHGGKIVSRKKTSRRELCLGRVRSHSLRRWDRGTGSEGGGGR